MKIKTVIALCLFTVFCLLVLTACGKDETPQMVNELQFSLDNIESLIISYDEENISFYASNDNTLIIKEFMTKNKRDYYAKVNDDSNSIKISEGNKPLAKSGFTRYIEVYLPTNFNQSLTVTSTKGGIDLSNMDLNLSLLRIDSTSGTVTLDCVVASEVHLSSTSGTLAVGSIQADSIRLDTTSGSVTCNELNGAVNYTSTSGDFDVKSAIGSGSYRANNSGKLGVVYSEVTGDLSFFNKNDAVTLTLPDDLQFSFEATTKNGSVTTNFQQSLTKDGRTTKGSVGGSATVTVKVETSNGNIEVTQ